MSDLKSLRWLLAAIVALGLLGLSACGDDSESESAATPAAGEEAAATGGDEEFPEGQTPEVGEVTADGKRIAFLTQSDQCLFCAKVNRGVKEAVEAAGAELDLKSTLFDAAEQAQQANQVIAQKPDAVILYPADANAILPTLQRIQQAGIPSVIVDSMPPRERASLWTAYRGSNDVGYGRNAAKALVEALEEKGRRDGAKVAIMLGTPNHVVGIMRENAFKEELSKLAPDIEIIATEHGDWDQSAATESATGMFTRLGDEIDGVFGIADNMTAGVITAAKRAGLDPSEMAIVSVNCTVEGTDAIEAGDLDATFISDGYGEGLMAGTTAAQLANGDEVPAFDFLAGPKVTKANTADCDPLNE
jgi:ABC-type sugar transport system substrate-binding protein